MKNKKKSKTIIGILGLGYVGLPLAVEFSLFFPVIGFDTNRKRVKDLKKGIDQTDQISKEKLAASNALELTHDKQDLKSANIFIITVPTPVDKNNKPNLKPLMDASGIVGKLIKKGSIIIFESTVFPGCTEQVCVPVLEKQSSLIYNKDFFCGYSPERINPGDTKRTLKNIKKITSGSNEIAAMKVDNLYKKIISAGTFKASSIMVAEAAKVIENTQRDLNIALINELAIIFNKLNIDTHEILEAASTKWNFLPFKPGLVGGHCIGVDPYYLTHKAIEVGYHPDVILAGRRINDNMAKYIADITIEKIVKKGINPSKSNIGILGLTFKENCSDLRNTKVLDIIRILGKYNCNLKIADACADFEEVKNTFGFELAYAKDLKNQDAIILAVAHNDYLKFTYNNWDTMLKDDGIFIDIKSLYSKSSFRKKNIDYWRL